MYTAMFDLRSQGVGIVCCEDDLTVSAWLLYACCFSDLPSRQSQIVSGKQGSLSRSSAMLRTDLRGRASDRGMGPSYCRLEITQQRQDVYASLSKDKFVMCVSVQFSCRDSGARPIFFARSLQQIDSELYYRHVDR